MDDDQRYLFDLRGWITIPDALDPEQLESLNATFDEQVAAAVGPDATSWRFGDIIDWGPDWLNLIDNERVLSTLEVILGPGFRLDHDYADLIRRGKGPIGTRLHGGATPFDPGQTYSVNDGRIHCGLVVVAYNLRDVNPGDGGFAGVAGSHKANFELPEDWKELEVDPPRPFVTPVTGPAGTAIVFTEAMSHGTLPWRGAGERRTVFLKYNPHPIAWSARFYDRARFPDLTPRQRAILEPPNARYGGRPTA
ncbi:MAG TPA: phytanoyl-CoA dioxygenase family protein [Candidatus Limnocylindrales bacterium]|nr:phytanoyl-CoA dioxygenase family protein [Candidatus Limnocylindrales bacterium]